MPVDRDAVARALAEANAKTGLFRTGPVPVETGRERGFYWVQPTPERMYGWPYDGPIIAAWSGAVWEMPGVSDLVPADWFVVVSPRLTPPAPSDPPPRLRVRWGVPVGDASDGGGA